MEEQGEPSNANEIISRQQLSPQAAISEAVGEAVPRIIDLSPNRNNGTINNVQASAEVLQNNRNATSALSGSNGSPQQNRSPQWPSIRVRSLAELQSGSRMSSSSHRQPPRPGYSLPPAHPLDYAMRVTNQMVPVTMHTLHSRDFVSAAIQNLPGGSPMLVISRQSMPEREVNAVINLADEEPQNDEDAEDMEVDGEREEQEEENPTVRNNDPAPSSSVDNVTDADEGDVGSLCAICYTPYTNSGEHRLSCLKCGHLFGESCIKHWLRAGCSGSNKRCPSCNSRALPRDIRILYAKNLVALDTSEKDRLTEKVEKLISEKNQMESQLNHSNLRIELLTNKLKEYEEKIKELTANNNQREQNTVTQRLSMFSSKLLSSFVLCPDGGCRALAFNNHLSLLLASQASTNPLFPGFGVRKFNMEDMKPTTYQNIHKKSIRDMCFSQHDRTLLSVSLDCTAKLFDSQSNAVVQTFQAPVPLWSCTWSTTNANQFYCGSQNGTWFMFDKRHQRPEPEQIIETFDPKDKSGIISLCHIPPRAGRFMPNGGVIACRLNHIVAHYPSGDSMSSKVLPIEGSFMSMTYNQSTDHLLISAKANTKWNSSRHMICQLSEMKNGEADCEGVDILQTFYGSRITNVLSKSAFVHFPNGDLTVCAYNARNSNIDLWSVVSETKLAVNDVTLAEPVLDICSFRSNDDGIIIPCLSDKKLSVIKLNFNNNN